MGWMTLPLGLQESEVAVGARLVHSYWDLLVLETAFVACGGREGQNTAKRGRACSSVLVCGSCRIGGWSRSKKTSTAPHTVRTAQTQVKEQRVPQSRREKRLYFTRGSFARRTFSSVTSSYSYL
jgi:hypothetical protein